MNYFVTAIDTDSGKTLVSAILCQALKADYWKPIQAGLPRDAETVKKLVGDSSLQIFPETYLLNTPASPHAAAKIDGVHIDLNRFQVPTTAHDVIIEGAGGCLVPINDSDFVIDIAIKLQAGIVLVADLYLGSINHTLLTIEALTKRRLTIKGIIFNGVSNVESERIILHHSGLKPLLHVQQEKLIDASVVKKYADIIKNTWYE